MISLIMMCILSLSEPVDPSVDLAVTIPNIKEHKGEIVIGIFDSREKFPKAEQDYRQLRFPVQANQSSFVIKDIQLRNCAVAIYHDQNSDGKCNLNFLGIPKEGYGFSNNVKPRFRAPAYESCKINLQESANITVKLIY